MKIFRNAGFGGIISSVLLMVMTLVMPGCSGLQQAQEAAQETAVNLDGLYEELNDVGSKLDALEVERKAAVAAGDRSKAQAIMDEGKQVYALYLDKRDAIKQGQMAFDAARKRIIEAKDTSSQWWNILGIAVGTIGSIFGLGGIGSAIAARAGQKSSNKELEATENALRTTASNAKNYLGIQSPDNWSKFKQAQNSSLDGSSRAKLDKVRNGLQ